MLRECAHVGCRVLTLGLRCITHEPPVTRAFPRGRLFSSTTLGEAAAGRAQLAFARSTAPRRLRRSA
jgi:hypothetical protein